MGQLPNGQCSKPVTISIQATARKPMIARFASRQPTRFFLPSISITCEKCPADCRAPHVIVKSRKGAVLTGRRTLREAFFGALLLSPAGIQRPAGGDPAPGALEKGLPGNYDGCPDGRG